MRARLGPLMTPVMLERQTNLPSKQMQAQARPAPTVDAGTPTVVTPATDAGTTTQPGPVADAGTVSDASDAGAVFPRTIFNLWEDTVIGDGATGADGGMGNDNWTPFAPPPFTCQSGFERCPGMIDANNNKPFTCCHSTLEVCHSGDDFAFCSPADDAECSAIYGPKYSKECSGANQNACCAVDEECGNWLGKAYCIKNCPTDTTPCNNPWNPFDNTTDCCLEGGSCEKVNGFYQCSYPDEAACPAATHHCPGETLSLCCPEGTVCSNNGAGAAVCTDVDGVRCSVDEHCGEYATCINDVGPDYSFPR